MESHSEILERVEAKGITLSERKARFALHFAANENKAAAARAAGYEGAHSRQCGQNLFHDPEVQKAIAEMQKYIQVEITEDFIKCGLTKEALEAASSRDRREAFHLLGKTKGMFRDVVDTTIHSGPHEYLQEVEAVLGKEVRDKMAQAMGLA
jgi:hypothetical protein